ncbi:MULTISPECIES: phage head-tail connector protein [unclassified Mesorhizobium]|uniref:head-tail connector protein n=1 Tax=unclassified Mesorhizobium TaxID=325217 RepID=UPI001FDED96E|nr:MULTISPECIES: phage head-tail connector protein [unclassified Mesorhizobium]
MPTDEPVTVAEAKRHVRAVDFDDDDECLASLIAVARNHVEKYCGVYLASQTVEVKADDWCDFAHLPVGPVTSITSIAYVDADGDAQTLDDTVYEHRGDAIVVKYGQTWPSIQPRSLITLTAVIGTEDVPPAVKHAMLIRLADLYETRETADESGWTTFDSLLSNHRYY